MKIYTLIYVTFDTTKSQNFNASVLLFSDNYDKIIRAKATQKESIIKHLEEVYGKSNIEEIYVPCTSDANLTNYCYKAKTSYHMLVVSTITAEPKTNKEKVEALNVGDLVTIKPEALEATKYNDAADIKYLKVAKITDISQTEARIMFCALQNPSAHINSTSGMAANKIVPISWLQKLYI